MNRPLPLLIAGVFLLAGCGGEEEPPETLAALRDAGRLSTAASRPAWHEAAEIDWSGVPAVELRLYPQRTVMPGLDGAEPIVSRLRAVSDGERLALRIEWPDAGADRYATDQTDRFADALAVQFAADDGGTLPYIGMGEPERPVSLWFWRAGRGAEALTARGFGTLAPDTGASPPAVDALRTAEGWSVTLSGPLPDSPMLPVAVATWDGAAAGRDGRKLLSPWLLLQLEGTTIAPSRRRALLVEGSVEGDPRRGEKLVMEKGCVACHRLPSGPPSEQGPDLNLAGGIHWPGYLRRAIQKPNAFIVPGAGYQTPEGRSLMPGLDLSEGEVDDILAYLSSLR